MSPARALSTLLVAAALVVGCSAQTGPYDPDWDPNGPIAGGKADGLLDILPVLSVGESTTGHVGGDRSELFRMDLARTDRIEVAMTVTDGDLNPHLSVFYGTSAYVSSESWNRDGDTLTKIYEAESAGAYVLAVRAYQGEGSGDYSLSIRCVGGPCAGELPPPASHLEIGDVAGCITKARRCAFERLPRYDGAVGPVRARTLVQECLDQATIWDGSSCSAACEWVNPDDEDDTAAALCGEVISALPFYADTSDGCRSLLDSCMSDCFDAAYGDDVGDQLSYSTEGMCFTHGFNGNCDSFARSHATCGGSIQPDSAGECNEHCESTSGAHVDDLDGICSYSDTDCDSYCDVDIDFAVESCGGLSPTSARCIEDRLDDTSAWFCFRQVEDRLADMCDLPTDATGEDDTHVLARSAEERWRYTISDSSEMVTIEERQVYRAAQRLDFGGRIRETEDAFRFADDGMIYMLDATSGDTAYDWVKWYAGDNEVGVIFFDGTTDIAAVVSDGDIDCVAR